MLRLRLAALACLAVAACTCGQKTATEGVGLPGEPGSLKLKPLPTSSFDVPLEALPGAKDELAVVASRPQGEVNGEVRPTITFGRPVKTLEQVEPGVKVEPVATIAPPLEGEWHWLGSASVEFIPSKLPPASSTFTVTVTKGLRALDGAQLKADHVFTFETPTLKLQDVSPSRGDRWLKPDDTVKLLFNQGVKDADLVAAARFEVEGEAAPWKVQLMGKVSIQDERRAAREKARAEGRPYEMLDDDARGWKNRQVRYTLAPEKPFPLDKAVKLTFAPTLKGEEGPLTPKAPIAPVELRTYGPLKLASARLCEGDYRCPYGPLILTATNEVDLETLKGHVTVAPAVELDWDEARAYRDGPSWAVALPGKWRPGTQYKVSIAKGVGDVFHQASAEGFDVTLRTSDLSPALVTGGYQALIEATPDAAPRLPVEVSNLKTLDVKMWKLSLPELAAAAARAPYDEKPIVDRAPDFSETQTLGYPKNHARVHGLELSKLFGESKTGVALVSVNSPQLEYRPKDGFRQLAQVTDLAAHIKIAPKQSLVWVTRLSSGAPVAQADVQVLDATGAVKWSGQTDAQGLADVPGAVALQLATKGYDWEYPFALVTAAKDGDFGFTANTWTSGVEPYEFGLTQGWEAQRPQPAGFVFADRGIYRPGDTVHLKGVARYRTVGELKAPSEGSLFAVEIHDSKGTVAKKAQVKTNAYGTFTFDLAVPKDAPLGYWSAEVKGKAPGGEVSLYGNFRVEEYRAPQFRVDVATPKKDLIAGDALTATVSARYLFGGTMSDAKAKWSAHRSSASFSSEAAPDFNFAQETWWYDDREPEAMGGFFGSGDGRLDAKGELQVAAGQVEAPGEKTASYVLEGEVEDVNRQSVAGRVEVTVHPAAFYVGLRAPSGFLQAGKEAAVDTVVADVTGKRAPGRGLTVSVLSRTWKSVKKKDASGGFTTLSEPVETEVATCALKSEDAPVPCKFTPAQGGFYVVKAKVKDDQGRQHTASLGLYVTGEDFVAWQRNDTDRIELVPDKTTYDVGDVARVLVKSPYPTASGVLTVEREGVLSRRVVTFKGSVTAVEIPITEDMVPNVFAGVVLVHPRSSTGGQETGDDPGRPAARIGLAKLGVERKSKRLAVKVTTDKPSYHPGDTVTANVAIADAKGGGTTAEVTFWAVDEAVLRLTSYQTPDPIAAIFPERPLSVRLGEPLLNLVRRRSYGEKGEIQGGGGGGNEGKGFRSNFKTTILFETVEAKDGKATLTFKLPDNLTTFRLMAVAVTMAERFGSGETSVEVNKPLLALPALPRFARVGDRFEAGVVVHAQEEGKGEATVTAQVEGGAALDGAAEQKVAVAPGAPKEVRFAFKANAPGKATFRFRVKNGAFEDGVQEAIPLEVAAAVEAVAVAGDTTEQRVEGLTPPKDVLEGEGGLTVTLASTSLGNFGDGFRQLVEYPYGCLEQQSSRLVPFVALREIAGQFNVPWPTATTKKQAQENELNHLFRTYLFDPLDVSEEKDPDQVIAKTVRSILQLEDDDGSFRYWPTATCSSSWGSAWATLSLSRARDVGFDVNPSALAKAEGYLGKVLGGQCHACEHGCPDETRVFAAYVLARLKKPKPSFYPELYGKRKDLSLFSRALLANAMFVGGGDRKQANALLQELLNQAKESPQGLHFAEVDEATGKTFFASDTRTTGAVLQALTDISPDHPYVGKLAHYLTSVRQGSGSWRTTQEAAFSLLALTQVLRTKEKDTPSYVADVALGAKSLVSEKFEGRSLAVKESKVTMKDLLAAAGGQQQPLTFKKNGAGVLYYSATMRYLPAKAPTTAVDQGLFVQRWFEPYAGGGQATAFHAGDLVRVRVRVATNQERHYAAIAVPLPAGLEPVDTSLGTTAKLASSPNSEGPGEGYDAEGEYEGEGGEAGEEAEVPYGWGFWSPFNHVEKRDSKVVLFADHLPAGVHVSTFVTRATTPGTYVLSPARGELMYEPEVWGRSEGGTFEVSLPTPVSAR